MDKNEEIIKLLKEYNQEHIIELLNKLENRLVDINKRNRLLYKRYIKIFKNG